MCNSTTIENVMMNVALDSAGFGISSYTPTKTNVDCIKLKINILDCEKENLDCNKLKSIFQKFCRC